MISVLYVDDEPSLLEICRTFLEQTGEFRVDTCGSAQEALSRLSRATPTMQLSQTTRCPFVDGITFLKEVRRTFGDIPFILFTGRGREEVAIEALACGADFYIQKGGNPSVQFAELGTPGTTGSDPEKGSADLRESEKRLSDIINFLPDATFAIDSEGKVIAWNHAIVELTGVPAQDMLGRGDHEYAIPFYGHRRPMLIDLIFEPEERIAAHYTGIIRDKDVLIAETGMSSSPGENRSQYWGRRAPSTTMRVSMQARSSPSAILRSRSTSRINCGRRSKRSQPPEAELRTQYDKLASSEQRLRESEEKYRTLVETTPDIVWEVDADGKIVYVSPQVRTILGFHPEEMISGTPFDFMPGRRARTTPGRFHGIVPQTAKAPVDAEREHP